MDEWWEGRKGCGEFVVMVKGKASETIKSDLQFACVYVYVHVCVHGF